MTQRIEQETGILVAQDRPDAVAMDIVRCLFNESFRHLRGLFIEDPQLFEHARSRLAREVLISGIERRLEIGEIGRQLRAQAAEVRRQFESSAAMLGVPFSFEIARGEPLVEIARVVTGAELVVVSLSHEAPEARTGWTATIQQLEHAQIQTLLLARKGWSTGDAIIAVLDDSELSSSIANLATRLAQRSRSALTMLGRRNAKLAQTDPVEKRAKPAELNPRSGRLELVDALEPEVIVATALRERARLVIMPWRNAPNETATLARLLRQTGSAVLLLK